MFITVTVSQHPRQICALIALDTLKYSPTSYFINNNAGGNLTVDNIDFEMHNAISNSGDSLTIKNSKISASGNAISSSNNLTIENSTIETSNRTTNAISASNGTNAITNSTIRNTGSSCNYDSYDVAINLATPKSLVD